MEVFVLKSLERLRSESSRRDTEFRDAADLVIRTIQENAAKPNRPPDDGDADKYFRPFQLACDIKTSKIRMNALDCIEKMISFGYLHGTMKIKQNNVDKLLVDIIIDAVCSCRDDKDEQVQLQVIKALHTAISSPTVKVQDTSLTNAIRACYHICLNSRNQVNKNTAKATLKQVLNTIFQRMEKVHETLPPSAFQQQLNNVANTPAPKPAEATNVAATPSTTTTEETPAPAPAPVPSTPAPPVLVPVKRIIKKIIQIKKEKPVPAPAPAPVPVETSNVKSTTVEFVNPFGKNMYDVVAQSLGYSFITLPVESVTVVEEVVPVVESTPEPEIDEYEDVEIEEEITEMVPSTEPVVETKPTVATVPVSTPMKAPVPPPVAATPNPNADTSESGNFLSQAHKDAYLVFKAMCRLTLAGEEDLAGVTVPPNSSTPSRNTGPNGAAASPPVLSDDALLANPMALQSKLLSMDLVLGLLEASGPAMRNGPRFIATIKQYLCVGLLKNFVSTIPALSTLSLKTFMALMRNYKRHIAAEIEVFLSTVFLRMLNSPASSHEQKLNVLQAFRSMCTDPASVLETFLNYDCTEGRQNVFEDSVRVLGSIAQARIDENSRDEKKIEEAVQIRNAAMMALSAVMQSIVVLADAAAKQVAESEGKASGIFDTTSTDEQRKAKEQQAAALKDDDDDDVVPDSVLTASGNATTLTSPLASPGNAPLPLTHAQSSSAALARSYDEQKKRRALLDKAVVKFSVKPKKGIEYMQSVGLCGDSAASIASIFHELRDVLDKTAIGEYMGEEKANHVAVLHAYIDQIDFTGLSYDDAVRKFLSGFRLPGEAQKIDRMMEKFAERFCACNPGVFPSADTAFILAYSIIMLHTDAHNPNIKPEKKMTKDSFLRNNRGIANGADLPAEFLSAIYDSIVSRPFTLREDDALREKAAKQGGANLVDERTRRAAERAEIVKQGQLAMTSARQANTARLLSASNSTEDGTSENNGMGTDDDSLGLSYYSVSDVLLADHVRPMFDVAWGPLLAVFSVNFETAGDNPDDAFLVNTCLSGFNQAIHVAGCLRMEAERDMLVATLCKFTLLEPGVNVREFRGKHVAAQRALLSMAFNEGNYLGVSWGPVLICISSLARLINMSQGGKEDAAFFSAPPSGPVLPPPGTRLTTAERRELDARIKAFEREREIERLNASLVGANVLEADITRLYTRSTGLSSEAIVDFVTQLAAVSLQELSGVVIPPADFPGIGNRAGGNSTVLTQPRVHSLQKVVEVADFNMAVRPRMAWARIWDLLSRYFTAVCCSSNTGVAMFAIDSLKQLAVKFMAKPELKSFHFQTKFLYPFLAIMEATSPAALASARALAAKGGVNTSGNRGVPTFVQPSPDIRELILHVCANIIRARYTNIRSGWHSFMGVYAAAASDNDELLVSLSFSMAHEVLTAHFEALVSAGAFVDAVKCMIAFGSNIHTMFALRAIDHCANLGASLARGRVPLEEDTEAPATLLAKSKANNSTDENGPTTPNSNRITGNGNNEWYDLDSKENMDVIDDSRDKNMLAKLGGNHEQSINTTTAQSSSKNKATNNRGYNVSTAFDGSGDGPEGPVEGDEEDPDSAAEVFAHEDATDAAMLAADDQPGGLIRRFTDCKAHMRLWWPLLTGLGGLLTADPRIMVRMRVLHALFALLRRYGPGFSPELWALIYSGVLLPLFDDVRHASEDEDHNHDSAASLAANARPPVSPNPQTDGRDMEGEESAPHFSLAEFSSRSIPAPIVDPNEAMRESLWPAKKKALAAHAVTVRPPTVIPGANKKGVPANTVPAVDAEHEWLRTTCMPALSSLVRLQSRFFTRLHFLLPALCRLIESCIDQEIEGLARIGVACLRLLLAEAGPRFNTSTWQLITSTLKRLFKACTPAPLLESRKLLLGIEDDSDEEDDEDNEKEQTPVVPPTPVVPTLAVGVEVKTAYGNGTVAAIIPENNFVEVTLPYGRSFLQVSAVTIIVPEVVPVPVPVKVVPKVVPRPANSGLPFSSQRVITQCVVQLELIGCVGVLADAHLDSLELEHVDILLALLQNSAEFAGKFNADRRLRKALWEAGFMRFAKHNKLPSLLRQETSATQQLLILLMRLYNHDAQANHTDQSSSTTSSPTVVQHKPWRELAVRHLVSLIQGILFRYSQLATDIERARVLVAPPYMQAALQYTSTGGSTTVYTAERDALLMGEHGRDIFRESAAFGPLVIQLLDGVLSWDDNQFKENLHWLYPLLTGLIGSGSVEIRMRLSEVFEIRLRKMLPIDAIVPRSNQLADDLPPSLRK